MAVYLAVGDSMSIDDYTGVDGGGAASQLARKLGIELVDLARRRCPGRRQHLERVKASRRPARSAPPPPLRPPGIRS